MRPGLDVVIVNWNAGEQLRCCLESIANCKQESYTLAQVVVVDNASADNSAADLDGIGVPLRVLFNQENEGFAAACNRGAAMCSGEYILFLNPDTVICETAINYPLEFMQRSDNGRFGICGVQMMDSNGAVSRSCARFPTLPTMLAYSLGLDHLAPNVLKSYVMKDWPHDSSREVDHIIGAFFLVRRKLFDDLRGFDQRFFMYLEDLDFSKRAHELGFRTYYMASTRIYHKGGGSSAQVKGARLFYSWRSRLQYAFKHLRLPCALLLFISAFFVEPWVRVAGALLARSPGRALETLQAYGMLWKDLPSLIAGRGISLSRHA